MIRCTRCKAPVDLRDAACWHCHLSLGEHPMRTDLRYVIGHSRLSAMILNLLIVGLFVATGFSIFLKPDALLFCIPVMILLCRLAV